MSDQGTPVIDIPVRIGANEKTIEALTTLFEQYQRAASMPHLKLPDGGKNLPDGMLGGTVKTNGKGTADNGFIDRMGKVARESDKAFKEVNKTLAKTGTALKDIFASSLKWAVRFSALTGLGMFGFDVLAKKTVSDANNAGMLGVTTGQMKAAQNVYGNQVGINTNNAFGFIRDTSGDLSKHRHTLAALGLDTEKGADSLPELMESVYKTLKGYTQESRLLMAETLGITNIFDTGSITGIMRAGDEGRLQDFGKEFQRQSGTTNVSRQVEQQYQDLMMKAAGNVDSIQATFVKKISDMSGPLGKLSDEITKSVNAFIEGPGFEALIKGAADSVEWFAKQLENPTVIDRIKEFGIELKTAVNDLRDFINTVRAIANGDFSFLTKSNSDNPDVDNSALTKFFFGGEVNWKNYFSGGGWKDDLSGIYEKFAASPAMSPWRDSPSSTDNAALMNAGTPSYLQKTPSYVPAPYLNGIAPNVDVYPDDEPVQYAQSAKRKKTKVQMREEQRRKRAMMSGNLDDLFGQIETERGLPAGIMKRIATVESGLNPNAIGPATKYGRAKGMFQFMEATGNQYGLQGGDFFDAEKSALAAGKYLEYLSKLFDGDVNKMLAGYNWGEGNVQKLGLANAPRETVDYIAKVTGQQPDIPWPSNTGSDRTSIPVGGGRQVIQLEVKNQPGSDIIAMINANLIPH